MDVPTFNSVLLTFTAAVCGLALIGLLFLFLSIQCSCCKRRTRASEARHSIPTVHISVHNDKISTYRGSNDLEYIDSSLNTGLISSTVKVNNVSPKS
ncbi:unnamed protein product [Caenorhabditis auriculariae]|uniref:Uncharacterized protein n=1 Tax=Caenorhabditis auriculariae TaxID=2777116 RepID=A0A8S1GVX7_9PELO|nr:unnamed protein product [Caenorhabditis auriculariae]